MPTTHPLDQLRDIQLPQAVGWWPLALGWWLLAALLIGLAVTCYVLYRQHKKTAYRRLAIRRVNQFYDEYLQQPRQHAQAQQFCAALNRLLKEVASQSYSTQRVSRLTQQQWLVFLDHSANRQDFTQGPGQVLASAPYDKHCQLADANSLKACCIEWIRRHQ